MITVSYIINLFLLGFFVWLVWVLGLFFFLFLINSGQREDSEFKEKRSSGHTVCVETFWDQNHLLVLCSQHLAQSTEIHKKTFEHYYDGTVGHTVQCSTYLYGTVCKRSENNQMV